MLNIDREDPYDEMTTEKRIEKLLNVFEEILTQEKTNNKVYIQYFLKKL